MGRRPSATACSTWSPRLELTATSTTPPTYSLLALDTGTGKPLWQLALQSPLGGSSAPVLSAGVLYLAEQYFQASTGYTPRSVILAIKASDGTVLWQTTPVAAAAGNVVVSDGTVCYSYISVNGSRGGIVALHVADGSLSWQATTQSGGPVPLAAGNGVLYAVDQGKWALVGLQLTLHAYDASTGKSIFEQPFPSLPVQLVPDAYMQLQVVGGAIYLVTWGVPAQTSSPTAERQQMSVVLALSASDGSLKWDHTSDGVPGLPFF